MIKLYYKTLILILVSILICNSNVYSDDILEEPLDNNAISCISMEQDEKDYSKVNINARFAIVMESKTSRILYEKNSTIKTPMASTTKIMTCILAIEHGNLEDEVIVSEKAASTWGSSIKLSKNEKINLLDLLYGLMLKSGNDAAVAIAEHIGGDYDSFIKMMNNKAKEIGALNTNFESPHGLDSNNHYSTAYDMAIITRYALQNELFRTIVSTKSINAGGRSYTNTNEMLFSYQGADGVKTGYTGKAGRCLVTSATRDGMQIISVVLNCDTRTLRAKSSSQILNYSFSSYSLITLNNNDIIDSIVVDKGKQDKVNIKPALKKVYPLTKVEQESLNKKVYYEQSLKAPVFSGSKIGKIEYFLGNEYLLEVPIITEKTILKKTIYDYLFEISNLVYSLTGHKPK